MSSPTYRIRPEAVEWRKVDDEVVALELATSTYLGINASGAALWPLLEAGATTDALAEHLVEQFAISRAQADVDVETFLAQLRERELVTQE